MRGYIEADVRKLIRTKGPYQRFMILIIDTRETETPLGSGWPGTNLPTRQSLNALCLGP
jgi:hypothetical protein